MTVMTRHLHAELLRVFIVVMLLLLGLFGFFDLSVQLDDVGQGSYTTYDAILFTLRQLPQRAVELTPFAMLLTVVAALGLMAARSELVIMRGAGLSPMQIGARVFGFGAAMMVLVLIVQSLVAPPLTQRAEQLRASAMTGSNIANDASFWLRSQDGVVHIGALENARVPLNIEILEFGPDATLTRAIHAARADIPVEGPWQLKDVVIKRFAGGETSVRQPALAWTPTLYARQLAVLDRTPDSLAPRSLYRYINYLQAHDQDSQPFEIALWQKLSLPLTTFAMLLLGLPMVFVNPRGANIGLRISIAAGIGLAAYAFIQVLGNLAFLYSLSAPLMMLTPGLLLCLGALLWLRRL